MNSRERVLIALNHQEPDRVPIDVGGTRQTGIAASTYHCIKERLGLSGPTRVYDIYQMLAEIDQEVADRLGADFLALPRPLPLLDFWPKKWKPFTLEDGTPVEVPAGFNPTRDEAGDWILAKSSGEVVAKMPAGGYYFDRMDIFPGAAKADPEKLDVQPRDAHYWDLVAKAAEEYHDKTDKALILQMGPPYELFFGLGQGDSPGWMMTLAMEPDYVHSLFEKLTEVWLEDLRRMQGAVGDRVHVMQFNDDLGTQEAPFLSPKMFRELVFPYYKRGLDWVHENTDYKVFMHCCGSIRPMIPHLIEMGVDCLNPVQITAKNMDPAELKTEFGDKITFWGGGCDCQHVLPHGTPEEVAANVARNIKTFMPGGGYVCAAVHNIQAKVPPENVLAFFDTAKEVAVYG